MERQQKVDTDDGSKVNITSTIEVLWRSFRSLDVVGK